MEVTLTGQKTLEYRRLESSRSGQTGVFLNFFLQDIKTHLSLSLSLYLCGGMVGWLGPA